jgi:hypothetical protein
LHDPDFCSLPLSLQTLVIISNHLFQPPYARTAALSARHAAGLSVWLTIPAGKRI